MERVDFVKLSQTLEVGYDGEREKLATACDSALSNMAKACIATGKKGKLVVTLDLDPEGAIGLQVKASIKATPPEPNTTAALVFTDRRGVLTFDDAEQGKLELASIKGGEVV